MPNTGQQGRQQRRDDGTSVHASYRARHTVAGNLHPVRIVEDTGWTHTHPAKPTHLLDTGDGQHDLAKQELSMWNPEAAAASTLEPWDHTMKLQEEAEKEEYLG